MPEPTPQPREIAREIVSEWWGCIHDDDGSRLEEMIAAAMARAVTAERERNMAYSEAVTVLLECDHGDEQTCGCRDRALSILIALRATPGA